MIGDPMATNDTRHIALAKRLAADHLFRPAQRFFQREASSSLLLLFATAIALIWANSPLAATYQHFWHTRLSITVADYSISKTLIHWIDDGLMTFFFFTVGLEIKREILVGELSSPRVALLPVMAALGGMILPALVYLGFTFGTPAAGGWGIPMATDIAFALGAIVIFGKKLPPALRIFLAAFAIADDLGAVFIIALFYTQVIVWKYLVICFMLVLMLALANIIWIRWTPLYALLGLGVWFAVLGSGVHPTVAGIVVAMFIPIQGRYDTDRFVSKVNEIMARYKCEEQSCGFSILVNREHLDAVHALELACHHFETPLQRLEHALHPWVAFLILPVFALGNAGLNFQDLSSAAALGHPVTLGIALGLLVGKPLGICLFSYLAIKGKIASLPAGLRGSHIIGAAMLGGIGFTMSLFISGLSFSAPELLNYSKLGILGGSLLSAAAGILWLFSSGSSFKAQ